VSEPERHTYTVVTWKSGDLWTAQLLAVPGMERTGTSEGDAIANVGTAIINWIKASRAAGGEAPTDPTGVRLVPVTVRVREEVPPC